MKASARLRASSFGILTGLASSGALFMLAVATTVAQIVLWAGHLDPGRAYVAWRREILFFVSRVTGPHPLVMACFWAMFVGTIIAIRAGIRQQQLRPMLMM